MAKLQISESWVQSAFDAVSSKLYSGTSEIQRLIIASLLGL